MAKKNLEEQIKKICTWAFCGFFWYLVIGFFLLSDYPIQEQPFNHKKAYEAIKDALGLVAAFIAPAIAVALFSDWREQHALAKNEQISLEVKSLLSITTLNMEIFPRCGEDHLFDEAIRLHFQNMRSLDRLEKEITVFNDVSLDYVNKLKEINEFNYDCGLLLKDFFRANKDPAENKWQISSRINENLSKLKKLSEELKPLVVNPM